MIKKGSLDIDIEICDICGDEVGDFQKTHQGSLTGHHVCFSCGTIRWILREIYHGKDYHKSEYYRKGNYKFDFDKIMKVVIDEAKSQLKNGKYKD